ncbi:FAD/FMN-containing dehydrogenase [Mycoavidus cysteinexigens]|uniref:FAD/FMN-containing dehydrogenase n=2 Tax=Mycoavidus cysteinexigens TaxID=1553431 RepID=A0A2Z6EV70_9BURK|nr:ABC transporter substrate-binding protein [Mycoavidus cysteinexigens]BBE09302.1 FAD/FMN-containing dehydrogenase [Mycoavidus cysteinexigens]GAM51942.1 ABC transporter, periplasmic spermidine putrescine-binding protein PotD [bacterium endosymbiont of Mortierella elongata FMR23-6]GLR02039.1 dehydrogenase [Mycoavidus cysteinexigens]
MDKSRKTFGRRCAIKKIALGIAALATALSSKPSKASSAQRIIVRDAGGTEAEIFKDIFYKPFQKATGIEVASVTSEHEPSAQIRAMVENNKLFWDIAAISSRAVLSLTARDKVYLEKHELENDRFVSLMPSQFRSPYSVGVNVYTTVLAYRKDAFKGRPLPETWKDFWNVKDFPGRRALRRHPCATIEMALMADGVAAENIYPLDLDRAFRSLDRIKPHISVWWTSAAQTEQLLQSGEVDLLPVWIVRAYMAMKAGAPVGFSWKQHIYDCGEWAILKGSSNIQACRQFIQFASNPERQASLAAYGGYGPPTPDAFQYIDSKQKTDLLTYPKNLQKGIRSNDLYWLKHQEEIMERFNQWMLN